MSNPKMPIGKVETTEGTVLVERADGSREPLAPGAEVFQGDVIETGDDGHVALLMADQSQFSLGAQGRMTMDELVYDAEAQEGSALISVDVGVFVFVSGMIAKTSVDAMVISTPAMTMGIRGTKLIGRAGPEGHENAVTLLEEAGGHIGEITVFNQVGVQVLNQANQTLRVAGAEADLLPPMVVTSTVVDEMYGRSPADGADMSPLHTFNTIRPDSDDDGVAATNTDEPTPETAAETSQVLVEEVGQVFRLEHALPLGAERPTAESPIFADDYRDDLRLAEHRGSTEEPLDELIFAEAVESPILHHQVRLDTTLTSFADDLEQAEELAELLPDTSETLANQLIEPTIAVSSEAETTDDAAVDPIVSADTLFQGDTNIVSDPNDTESAGTEGTSLTADIGDPSDPSLATPSNDGTVEAGGSSASPVDPAEPEPEPEPEPETELAEAHLPAAHCNRHVPLEDIAQAWQQAAGDTVPETPAEWLMDVIDAGGLDFGDHNPATAEDARVLFQASQIATRVAHGHAAEHAHGHAHAHAHAPGKHDDPGKDHGHDRGPTHDHAHGHPHRLQHGEPAAEPGYVSAPAPDGPAAPLSEVQLT